jgi:hypothetical protein
MTLILNCLTADYVLQVSDRRLTFLGGPRSGQVMDDDRNKAVVWNGMIAFAYTGVTPIDDESTDIWFTRTLLDAAKAGLPPELPPLLSYLSDSATRAFARLTRLKGRTFRHAFVGVGWAKISPLDQPSDQGQFLPLICSISNAIDEDGNWLPEAQPSFTWRGHAVAGSGTLLHFSSAGQPLDTAHTNRIQRELRRVIKGGAGPRSATCFLVEAVRSVARRNKTVGSNLMVTCLPRKPAERAILGERSISLASASPNLESNSFQYMSARTTVGYGPHCIFGTQYMGDMKIDAPAGVDPTTGKINLTSGSIQICTQLPDPPKWRR